MATVYHEFHPHDGIPGSGVSFARQDVIQGTKFAVPCLDFAPVGIEDIFFFFQAINYGTGNLTLETNWYADTGTTGSVVWGSQVACITPNTDTNDIETKALAIAQTGIDVHLGTTNQRLHSHILTISNTDSIAAGDYVALRLFRNGNATQDDMAGDASVVMAILSYSDT